MAKFVPNREDDPRRAVIIDVGEMDAFYGKVQAGATGTIYHIARASDEHAELEAALGVTLVDPTAASVLMHIDGIDARPSWCLPQDWSSKHKALWFSQIFVKPA